MIKVLLRIGKDEALYIRSKSSSFASAKIYKLLIPLPRKQKWGKANLYFYVKLYPRRPPRDGFVSHCVCKVTSAANFSLRQMDPTVFDPARYFPPRRRALRACGTCRHRKSRCDGASPKCSLCVDFNVECVYVESHHPKIDTNTRILLERIQRLEDRLLAAPSLNSASLSSPVSNGINQGSGSRTVQAQAAVIHSPRRNTGPPLRSPAEVISPMYAGSTPVSVLDPDGSVLTMPIAHHATANHVYRWPILQAILDQGSMDMQLNRQASFGSYVPEATDAFFAYSGINGLKLAPESWRLFQNGNHSNPQSSLSGAGWGYPSITESLLNKYRNLIDEYFLNVHVFFPIIRKENIHRTLSSAFQTQHDDQARADLFTTSQYCLLLLVLCLGSSVEAGKSLLSLSASQARSSIGERSLPQFQARGENHHTESEDHYWERASLLLGSLTSDNSLEAAQCYTLARYIFRPVLSSSQWQ